MPSSEPATPAEYLDALGRNVYRLRTAAGLSQTALATRMQELGQTHWRQTTVSRVERADQQLRASEVADLIRILGDGVISQTRLAAMAREGLEAGGSTLREFGVARRLDLLEVTLEDALEQVRQLRAQVDDGIAEA